MGRFARAAVLLLAVGMAVTVAVPAGVRGASAAAPPAQDAAHGQELFTRYGCYECHGFAGQGAQATGPRLAPGPVAYGRFVTIVRDPIDLMPRYPAEFVSDEELADIYAYLQSIPRPPALDEIPQLNP
jgi:ubiquinol-cytochrome c reductase cytochrome c subunit